VQAELEQARGEIRAVQERQVAAEQRQEGLVAQVAERTTELERAQAELEQARGQVQAAQEQQAGLQEQVAARTAELERVQRELEQAQHQARVAYDQQEALREQVTARTAELEQARQTLVQTEKQIAAAQQQLSAQEMQQRQVEEGIQAVHDQARQQLQEAVQEKIVTLQPHPDRLRIRIGGEALFRPGQAALRPESRRMLDQVTSVLQAFPDYRARVEGHTDSVPVGSQSRWESNWDLSAARASAVVRYLEEQGVAPERLLLSGYAFYRALASNETPEGRAQNRRIEIVLLPPTTTENSVSGR
jgi:chemotaxis protein MotB